MTTPAAPNREIIVRSFQPGCTRAAAHKGGHADRTKHAGFLHFGGTAVAPNEVIGKSDLMSQVAGHYRGRKATLSHREPSEGAWRRKERRPLHHEGFGARLPPCGADFCITIVGSRGVGKSTLAVPIEHRLTSEILSSLTDVAKERSDDQHAKRD